MSTLNTIPIEQPLMYQRQGLYNNYVAGTPIADNQYLLPFRSKPFVTISSSTVMAYLVNICGNLTYKMPVELLSNINGDYTTYYWPANRDSGLTNIKRGYYYVLVEYELPPDNIGNVVDEYELRVDRDGGTLEAKQCVIDSLVDLAGGYIKGQLFKTEIFYMSGATTETQGAFNQSFDTSFDV